MVHRKGSPRPSSDDFPRQALNRRSDWTKDKDFSQGGVPFHRSFFLRV